MTTPAPRTGPRYTYTFDGASGAVIGWPGLHLAKAWCRLAPHRRIFPASFPAVRNAIRRGTVYRSGQGSVEYGLAHSEYANAWGSKSLKL